jgi:hypothetical protein
MSWVTKGVTSCRTFKADDGGNVAGTEFFYVLVLVGLQANNTANTHFFAG